MSLPNDDRDRTYPDRVPLPLQPQWRKDFPTDTPEDDLVSRREFTKFLVLTSGAMLTGQCWIALAGRSPSAPTPRKAISTVAELEANRVVEFRYPGDDDPCLLISLGSGRTVAYGQKCPHLACAVVPRLDEGKLYCPCHNGHFEVEHGRPTAGPPRRPLPLVTIEVTDGVIYATGVELRTV